MHLINLVTYLGNTLGQTEDVESLNEHDRLFLKGIYKLFETKFIRISRATCLKMTT